MCEHTYAYLFTNSYTYKLRVLTVNLFEQLGPLIFGLSPLEMESEGARVLTVSIRDVLALAPAHSQRLSHTCAISFIQ